MRESKENARMSCVNIRNPEETVWKYGEHVQESQEACKNVLGVWKIAGKDKEILGKFRTF